MRFAVVGCGWISAAMHGPAYAVCIREHPDLVPAACCDVDAGKAEALAKQVGFERTYTDLDIMLERERLDAVCLNVPPHLACELGCRVLRRGIALLTEKPPGLTRQDLERLIAAAHAGGARHMVAFNRRWAPLLRELRRQLGACDVEHVCYIQSRVGRRDADFSTTLIHAVDAVRALAGSDYRRVCITYQELAEVGPGIANYFLSAEMAGGGLAQIEVTPLAGVALERALVSARGWSAELRHPTGTDGVGQLNVFKQGELRVSLTGSEAAGGMEEWRTAGFLQEDRAFFTGLLSGHELPDGLESARQSVAVMEAVRERRAEVVFA